MTKIVFGTALCPVPLLRSIDGLARAIDTEGSLELTGEISTATIVVGFNAYRAHVRHGEHTGWIDLSASASWRTEMTLRIEGMPREVADRLVRSLRAALVTVSTPVARPDTDARMNVCRTA